MEGNNSEHHLEPWEIFLYGVLTGSFIASAVSFSAMAIFLRSLNHPHDVSNEE